MTQSTLTDLLALRHVVPLHHVGDTAVLWTWQRMMEKTKYDELVHEPFTMAFHEKSINLQKWRLN